MDKRYESSKKAGIVGIITNLFLAVIKTIVGLASHSNAMIADSINSINDVIASLFTYIGNKIASKPSDKDHETGHGKAEYIYSMIISLIMFLTVYELFRISIRSLFKTTNYIYSKYLVIVAIITIVTKLILYIYTKILYKKQNNLLLLANSKDHRNDTLIGMLTLISIFFARNNIFYIDGIVGIIISLWILYSAWKIFKESYDVLMDKSINEETKIKVLNIIKKYPEIKKIQHFISSPVGYKYRISFTIFVDGNISTFESHEIADRLEDEIEEKIPEIYLTIIHVNPLEVDKKTKKG